MKKAIKVLFALFTILVIVPFAAMALVAENADVKVVLKDYDPVPAEPDNTLRVWISVQNIGNEQLDNAYIKVNPEYPFSLVPGEDSIKSTGIIGTNSNKLLDYRLFVNENTKAGDYSLEFISCSDSECEKEMKKTSVTITVKTGGEPRVDVGIEDLDSVSFNKKSRITTNIVNKGSLNTKYLTITLDETDEYIVLSPHEVYVGELESDDFETAVFDIYFKSDSKNPETKIITLPFTLEYTDANSRSYMDEQTIDIRVYSQKDLYKYGLAQKPAPYGIYFLFAVIAVTGFFIYRRIRKKKMLKK